MMRRSLFSIILFSLSFCCLVGSILYGQAVDPELEALLKEEGFDLDLDGDLLTEGDLEELLGKELLDELFEESEWELDLKLRAGLGYGDNVLFGAFEEVDSGYLLGAFDGLYYRTVDDLWSAYVYFFGEHMEYFENVDSGKLYVTQGQVSRLSESQERNYGLSAPHLFYDQVFDASLDQVNFDTFGVSAHQVEIEPFVEFYFEDGDQLRVESLWGGSRYEDSYDDSDSLGGLVRYQRPIGERSILSLEYLFEDRQYLEKDARDAEGYAAEGVTRLKVGMGTISLRVNAENGWRFDTKLNHYTQRDEEAGYSDYDRIRFKHTVSRAWGQWDLKLSGRYSWYDYLVRPAEFGGDALLYRRVVEGSVNLSRTLNEDLALFLESQVERNRSNSLDNQFSAGRVMMGVEWSL